MTDDLVYGVRLFVPGTAATLDEWQRRLAGSVLAPDDGTRTEWLANDGSFGDAFRAPALRHEAAAARSALVLDLPGYLDDDAGRVAALIAALGDAGAVGVRLEQSMLGWPVAHWVRSLESGDPWMLYHAAVVLLQDGGVTRSCGMHAFGLPDAQVEAEPAEADRLLGSLNVYQLAEDPVLVHGDTFTPDLDTPRRRLERWPDDGYPPGHPGHNPFGTWRLGAGGGTADRRGDQRPVFIPSLAVVLAAAEGKAGRPLTRDEVEQLTDGGTCMMVTHADAKVMERSRGYADLEPALAWQQWQVLRGPRD